MRLGIRRMGMAGVGMMGSNGGMQEWQRINALLGAKLLQHIPAWDAAGAVATDVSGNGRNGAYAGTLTLGVDGIGDGKTAVDLIDTGVIGLYSTSLRDAINLDQGYYGVWAWMNDPANWATVSAYYLGKLGASAGSCAFEARKNAAYTITPLRRDGVIPSVAVMSPTTARWFHLGVDWDLANNKFTVFVNGAKYPPKVGMATVAGPIADDFSVCGSNQKSDLGSSWVGRVGREVLSTNLTDAEAFGVANPTGQIVIEGDSRSTAKPWFNVATELAFPTGIFAFGKRGLCSQATSGANYDIIYARRAVTNALVRAGVKNTLILWYGVNDAALTAQQIYDHTAALCAVYRAAGYNKIIVCTEIDAQGVVNAAWHTATYAAYNTLLRNGYATFADGIIDAGADARFQNAKDPAIYLVDEIHLTTAGYLAFGEIAAPVIAAHA